MMKPASVFAAIAIALMPQVAHAELPNGATVTFDMLKIKFEGGEYVTPPTADDLRHYTNMAHCVCGAAGVGDEQTLQYRIATSADTGTDKPAELWTGKQCDDEQLRGTQCRKIEDIGNIDDLSLGGDEFEFAFHDVMTGMDPMEACMPIEGERSLWFMVDTDGDGTFDHQQAQSFGSDMGLMVTGIDTTAPPLPTAFKGSSAEGAIRLTWTAPSATKDIEYYQALCAKSDGSPALEKASSAQRYTRVVDLCGLDAEAFTIEDAELATDEGGVASFPADMAALDPKYICGEVPDSTATGMFIEGLENDVAYSVIVVAVDKSGNVSGVKLSKTVTPKPAFDFWEDLHNRGSNVEGGFCLAGTQGPGGTAGPLALVLGYLLLRRRRGNGTRTFARIATLGSVAALALVSFAGARVASAQGNTPYWEEQQEQDARLDDEDLVRWHVGLRLGPYVPDIDKQFGMDPGPYHEMFGGYQVLPMLDIDRIIWTGFGQFGIGGSVGYMQKSANAWATPVVGEDRMRSAGDENTFRLWPIAATAVYRFTWLDDNYGIPVVPYVRGGLSYYIWWMRTNGKTSSACWDGTDTPDCDADKALGATIGVQGSIGLAIRAERVDAAAATSMRAGGIQHAGFYGELSLAKVDGFGSDYKLSVGDATWVAGVNFEF